ncbi:hypothetical protein ACJIZ3_020547 [Penstemon smallii]|uniref:Telomere-associated protein Rif1 N-terminal domain-containing protein n=1 Tax=Penstemon smallii TaxID=265156 RepID=A0ABD3SJT1_9LAMI
MQAVVKLTSSLPEQMKNMSSVWTPPIYRRLVSADKRDRDMSERCLLKIMPIIDPPPATLSKALSLDMKKKLFSTMKELLDQGMKIQSLQAWGWFIRILGPYVMKNKHVVNEMLKILEQTFSDVDSQVQIASLVAWEGLIDALIQPLVQASHINSALENDAKVFRTSEGINGQTEADKHLKIFKLIMAPLIGIISSKCDVSVHASCLSTWSYLLHKLKDSVSCQSVIKIVWEPITEVIFRVGPDNKNIWLFNLCLDLLEALISGRNQGTTDKLYDQDTNQLSIKSTIGVRLASGKFPLRHYPISFVPWKLRQLDFFLKMISILVNRESNATFTPECRRLADDAALRLFGSLMEAVQRAFRCDSISYDEVMQCLNTIFRFLGKICKYGSSEDDSNNCCPHISLKFLEVVTERLEPSILESPLYKVEFDLKYIKTLECHAEIRSATVPSICFMESEDRVLPVVYLNTLYFSVVVNSSLKESEYESLLQQMQGYLKFLLSSYCFQEVLHPFVSLLYKNTMSNCLRIWVVLANCINDCIDGEKAQSMLKSVTENIGHSLVLHLLSYPFASWSSSPINFDIQIVVEVWKLLYVSIDQALKSVCGPVKSLSEDLCEILNKRINQITPAIGNGIELQLKENNYNIGLLLLYGSATAYVLEQLTLSMSSLGSHHIDGEGRKSNINNQMELVARFMKLFWENKEKTEASHLYVVPWFLSEVVNFVRCLHQNEDIVMLLEKTSSPLLQWLSNMQLLDEKTNHQLQILWTEILKSLQQSQPPLKFDSSFLKFQASLLETTLDHPNPAISKPTINFWNSTYGTHIKLEFPRTLLPVLDKLSRNRKINIFSRNHSMEDSISSLQRYKVPTTLKKCSKRVEIVDDPLKGSKDLDKLCLSAKRKRTELTEHQKEVRRAQQGRTSDCNGHGPGIRTYTNVDFSQGNDESQDSQDIRDAESILEMLRKGI